MKNKRIGFAFLLLFTAIACTEQKDKTDRADLINKPEKETVSIDYLSEVPPGTTPRLFAPDVISTRREHSAAMFTPDGREVWFGRMFPQTIWYIKKTGSQWDTPKRLALDSAYNYLYPVLTPDGNRLYLTSDRPVVPGGKRLSRGKGDVWYTDRTDGGWSEPVHMGVQINFGQRHSIGSVAANGSIYYTVLKSGNRPSWGVYYVRFENGKYHRPQLLTELTSDQPMHSPYVAPDENYLIYSSFHSGYGLSDLFISFRTAAGGWSAPRNLGAEINSAAKDEFPFVSPDGRYLFFNSNRLSPLNRTKIPDGPGNIYWVSTAIIDSLRVKTVSGRI